MADVSVVVTCHNEESYIEAAIRSVAAQTAFDRIREVVVVNDGSTDRSREVLDRLAGEIGKLMIIDTPGLGLPSARNAALSRSIGEFVAILDGDDLWAPTKLERQLRLLERNSTVALVYTDFVEFAAHDMSDALPVRARSYIPSSKNTLEEYFVKDGPIVPSTVVIRRSVLDDVGGFEESIRFFEDQELWLRLAEKYSFDHVREPLTYKRRHPKSITYRLDTLLWDVEQITRKFVARNPSLRRLVGRRMARRYGKVGSDCIAHGERARAVGYLLKSVCLDPRYWRAYVYLLISLLPGKSRLQVQRLAKRVYNHPWRY